MMARFAVAGLTSLGFTSSPRSPLTERECLAISRVSLSRNFSMGRTGKQHRPVLATGGGGGGSRISASRGYGGDGGDGGSGKRRPIIGLTLAYAIFVAVGGVMGYKKAGSKNSLISSLAVAVSLAAASYQMSANPASYTGIYTALVIVVALGAFMGYGWWKKRKAFPQGVTAGLSIGVAGLYTVILKGPQVA